MSATKTFTYSDVSEHTTKKDLYMVIHDKVYDTSSFVDEHPGGEEVLLDVGGQDATEAFEDVGHSDEAREILERLLVGDLKRLDSDPKPKAAVATSSSSLKPAASGGLGFGTILFVGMVAVGAYMAYQSLNQDSTKA
ncbi:putative cytochrome b5 [Dissoconium aciculare CBS 342.82]|uniref:Cytochrome b5 n=1 Tax=Dissoconium aciculare CBS 342.82 TaxID=1314786 RepID=A0A6J3M9Q5_9PEZI|nr:putative cytochrome b5 [Dissoconium aciculare CBS 342.82]KAF1823542.1 putative cytochrome b5 [Dissoconium aciculare CBS 342.82]